MRKGIKVGDLVHMHRRRITGLGIAVSIQKDLKEYSGLNCDLYEMRRAADEAEPTEDNYLSLSFWSEVEKCARASSKPEAARAYIEHNHYGSLKKERRRFIQVHWIKKPSDYTSTEVYRSIGWYPASFLKSL